MREESGRGKSRFKIQDLPTDGRCSQAVLDFLFTTNVERLVPAEEDVGSEVSEWERREREEPSGGGGRGAGCQGGITIISAYILLRGVRRTGVENGRVSLCFSLWCASYFLEIGLGGGQRGACNVPPSRGRRKGTRQNIHRHSLDRLNARMITQKKPSAREESLHCDEVSSDLRRAGHVSR